MKKSRSLAVALLALLAASITIPVFSQSVPLAASSLDVREARALAVGADGAGRLWAVWEMDDGIDVELYFSYREDGRWNSPSPVHGRPDAWDRSPSLAVAADGTVWLAWSSSEMADPDRTGLYVSHWTGRRWTDPEAVPQGSTSVATEPSLAVAPDNTLWLAWVGFDGVDEEIFASYSGGRSWAFPQQVSADDHDPFLYDKQPRLAVGEDGQPWLVWTGHQSGVDDEIYASRWTGTTWTPEQMVSEDDDGLDVWPSLVLDAQGQPWVAWDGQVADGDDWQRRILVSHWRSDLADWAPEEVASSPLSSAVDEEHPALSLDGAGGVHLAWLVSGPSDLAIGYSRREGGQWIAPLVAHAGANTDALSTALGAEGVPEFLWIDMSPDSPVPAAWGPSGPDGESLQEWLEGQALPQQALVSAIPNRYLAFGDSITWGLYQGFYPYPARLEDKLDARVRPSGVINSGVPGEWTYQGKGRIGGEVGTYRPQYVILMEGTNDVTHLRPPSEVKLNLAVMIDIAREHVGVDHVKVMLGTLIPRTDNLNGATRTVNEQAIEPLSWEKNVPVCDPWQAYYDYGPWWSFYIDAKHPDETGMQILANTFYDCLLDNYSWLYEDTTPPTASLDPVQPASECHLGVPLQWSGVDSEPGTGVANYDVQVKIGTDVWTNWLAPTASTSASYTDLSAGQTLGFRVRARDIAGNVGAFTAGQFTEVVDTLPPDNVFVRPIGIARTAPFMVRWNGSDACGAVTAYQVQYRAGLNGAWQEWFALTPGTSGTFSPASPQYGETYYFQVRARDQANNWSGWSEPVSTILARYTLSGQVVTVRHEPVAFAEVVITGTVGIEPVLDGYVAYVVEAGDYDVSANRFGFGHLPPRKAVPVVTDVSGLVSVLPPHDDAITNGGFELDLTGWQVSGSALPSSSSVAHTGDGAVRLGGESDTSSLSQTLTPDPAVENPSLSFLARLEEPGSASTLSIELESANELIPPVSHTLTVESEEWAHFWYDLEGLASDPMTLTLTVSNSLPILLDEVSVGSAIKGSYRQWMPVIWKQ
jgi:lysophospholipase L1-like esterase